MNSRPSGVRNVSFQVLPRPLDEIADLVQNTIKWLDEQEWSLNDRAWVELQIRILRMTGGHTSARFENFVALLDEYGLYRIPALVKDLIKLLLHELRRIFRLKSARALEKIRERSPPVDLSQIEVRPYRPPRPRSSKAPEAGRG